MPLSQYSLNTIWYIFAWIWTSSLLGICLFFLFTIPDQHSLGQRRYSVNVFNEVQNLTSSLNSRLIYPTAYSTSHVGSDSHLFPFLPPSLLQTAVPWLSKLHNPVLLMPKNSYVIFFTLNIQACQLIPSKHIPLDLFSQSLPPSLYSKSPSSLIGSNALAS